MLRASVHRVLVGLYRLRDASITLKRPHPDVIPLAVPFPRDLGIEVTNVCNANCVFCAYQFRKRDASVMSQALFESVIAEYVSIGGGGIGLTPIVGDPLVDKGLAQKISHARSHSAIGDIHITTNGILLTHMKFEELVDASLTMITVSLSGFGAREYERVFRSAKYRQVISNLHAIASSNRFERVRIEIGLRTDSLMPWLKAELWRLRRQGYSISRNWFVDSWSGRIADTQLNTSCSFGPSVQTNESHV
jgi:sulfatase maturation enzyme AslB (radical SAM superfamily)